MSDRESLASRVADRVYVCVWGENPVSVCVFRVCLCVLVKSSNKCM